MQNSSMNTYYIYNDNVNKDYIKQVTLNFNVEILIFFESKIPIPVDVCIYISFNKNTIIQT